MTSSHITASLLAALKALIDEGIVKVDSFHRKDNKLAYASLLTPAGIADKVGVTHLFL